MSSAAPLKLPHVIIEHIEVDFPKDGWCAIEYDNIARIVGPSNLIVTNVSEEHKQALPASFKGCAAMTGRSLTTFLDAPPRATPPPAPPPLLRAPLRLRRAPPSTTRTCRQC